MNNNYKKFISILQVILICYEYYFCYNIHKTIYSIYEFIININKNDKVINNNQSSIYDKTEINELINIKEKSEFNFLYDNKYHKRIQSIEIIKCNLNDISILQKANLIKLELLTLSNNNIVSIDPLLTMNTPCLRALNLSSNKITADYIYVFKSMNFPNLNFLSLARNFIHNHNIFTYFEKYENLQF